MPPFVDIFRRSDRGIRNGGVLVGIARNSQEFKRDAVELT